VFVFSTLIYLGCGQPKEEINPKLPPTITTTSVTDVTIRSAKAGGNIINDGGSAITERGICWSLNPNPTISDNKTSAGNGIGSFSSSLSGLKTNSRYYVRAYATNTAGTSYGEEINFSTLALIPLNGLLGWWPFNGNSNDESGNGFNLSANNVTYSKDRFGNLQSSAVFNGIEFGGGSTMISNSTVFNIGQSAYSISVWAKISDLNQITRTIFNTDPHTGIAIAYNDNNAPGFMVYDIGSANGVWTILYLHGPKNDYNINDWYHLALIKNGLQYTFYINGVQEHTYTNSAAANYSYPVKFRLSGISPDNQIFNGFIDDVAIFNRALTDNEILKIYTGAGF
jgi:hypothetical protein